MEEGESLSPLLSPVLLMRVKIVTIRTCPTGLLVCDHIFVGRSEGNPNRTDDLVRSKYVAPVGREEILVEGNPFSRRLGWR